MIGPRVSAARTRVDYYGDRASALEPDTVPLSAGTRIGSYEIVSALGAGGMGEVYRAADTNLKRQVAIKILPAHVATDPDRLARFRREAELLAALNHPNIAQVFGLESPSESPALVMELVEGLTLADRLETGPIPLADALAIASQIAEAVEAAHDQGIVHRDLKPANVKVRSDGVVKVLDFGLAKAFDPVDAGAEPAAATVSMAATQPGVVLGTPAYMSPEQARGGRAGRQTDIWAFGVVLYEMLTGVSPFRRSTTTDTLASVVGVEPDYSTLPANVPVVARHLIRRCLEKDQKLRLKHIGDARLEVDEAIAALKSGSDSSGPARRTGRARTWPIAAVVAITVLAALVGWWAGHGAAPRNAASLVSLSIPALDAPVAPPFGVRVVAISRDGSHVAYASATRLWVRQLDRKDTVSVDTEALNPFFSPVGDWVGFFSHTGDGPGLKKVAAGGGAPISIVETPERPMGAAWGPDGTIVYATSVGLYQVSENGGGPRLLVKPDPQRKERAYAWPRFLPDGHSVLLTILPVDSIATATIARLDLKSLQMTAILRGGTDAQYLPTGHLVYASGQALQAVAFDLDTWRVRGEAARVPDLEMATATDNGAAPYDVSITGTLVAIHPEAARDLRRTLSWVDRRGTEEPLPMPPDRYGDPRVSPDGTRVAVDLSGAARNIWIWSLERRSLTKLTDGPTEDLLPVWSPDGRRIFFASNRTGNFNLYAQAADGATPAVEVYAAPGTQMPNGISPDGERLIAVKNFSDVSVLDLARHQLQPLLNNGARTWIGTVSPDGRWIAYESHESGRQVEIFLRPFPDASGRREKVSIDGGRFPAWGPKDSGELYYVDPNGAVMAAAVTLAPVLALGRVTKLFDYVKPPRGISGRPYDVSPKDGRFLVLKPAVSNPSGTVDISVVLNWTQELQRLTGR